MISWYNEDIVNHAFNQAKTHYMASLAACLNDDQPKDIFTLRDIIKTTRQAALQKYAQIAEEAQAQLNYK